MRWFPAFVDLSRVPATAQRVVLDGLAAAPGAASGRLQVLHAADQYSQARAGLGRCRAAHEQPVEFRYWATGGTDYHRRKPRIARVDDSA